MKKKLQERHFYSTDYQRKKDNSKNLPLEYVISRD